MEQLQLSLLFLVVKRTMLIKSWNLINWKHVNGLC
jgi:hypothetical protein